MSCWWREISQKINDGFGYKKKRRKQTSQAASQPAAATSSINLSFDLPFACESLQLHKQVVTGEFKTPKIGQAKEEEEGRSCLILNG